MSREVDTAEYMGMLRELIGQGHRVSVRVAGNSMSPFLKHGRDTVFFAAPDSEIKKGDIVFYTRPNGQYIMHRVCRVNPDGSLDISGDAQCVMGGQLCRKAAAASQRQRSDAHYQEFSWRIGWIRAAKKRIALRSTRSLWGCC